MNTQEAADAMSTPVQWYTPHHGMRLGQHGHAGG